MSPRNTRTGVIFERVLLPALQAQEDFYEFFARGHGPAKGATPWALPDPFRPGRTHWIDIVVRERASGVRVGVAVKWQQVREGVIATEPAPKSLDSIQTDTFVG